MFPATAIDNDISLRESWNLTKTNRFQIFIIVAIYPIVPGVPDLFLKYVPYTSVIRSLLDMFLTVFTVAALSMAYDQINRNVSVQEAAI